MADTGKTGALPASLTAGMAARAYGFGAVIDGNLDVRTVSDTAKNAAFLALSVQGTRLLGTCQDPDCDCTVRFLGKFYPDTRIVPVRVELDT